MKFKSKKHGKTWKFDGFAFCLRPNCRWRPFALWKLPSVRFFVEVSNFHLFHSNCLKCVPCCAMFFFRIPFCFDFSTPFGASWLFFLFNLSGFQPKATQMTSPNATWRRIISIYLCLFSGDFFTDSTMMVNHHYSPPFGDFFWFLSTKKLQIQHIQHLMGEWSTSWGQDAKFKTFGCGSAIASSSYVQWPQSIGDCVP